MPDPTRWATAAAQASGDERSEARDPDADGLVGHDDAAFGQQLLGVTQAEAEAKIEPDGVLDDGLGEAEAVVWYDCASRRRGSGSHGRAGNRASTRRAAPRRDPGGRYGGDSHLVEQDEAGTIARLKALRKETLEPILARHGGRFVKLMGDGALIEFAVAHIDRFAFVGEGQVACDHQQIGLAREIGDDVLRDPIRESALGGPYGTIAGAARNQAKRTPPASLEAYEFYLLGIEEKHKLTKESLAEAKRLMTRATEVDPGFARGWLGLEYSTER